MVTRYVFDYFDGEFEKHDDGNWVKYPDYAALEQQLAEEIEQLLNKQCKKPRTTPAVDGMNPTGRAT